MRYALQPTTMTDERPRWRKEMAAEEERKSESDGGTRVRRRPQNGRPKAIKTTVWNDGSVTTLVVGCPKTQLKYQ
jgi:hypothetical protein